MMNQRIIYLLIGCVIGFVIGYFVRSIRETKEIADVEEVDPSVLKLPGTKSGGLIQSRLGTNLALFFVVVLVAWAAIASQFASNDVKDTQHEQDKIVACNQIYLTSTINALNARTSNSQAQSDANVDLQKAQATFLSIFFVNPPATNDQREAALQTYFDSLTKFTTTSATTTDNVAKNPYPTATDFTNCIKGK